MRVTGIAAFAALSLTGPALAADINPAIVYDMGGKFDQSFNEAAYAGAERYKADTGVEYRDFEVQNDSQREQALRHFARCGHDPNVAIGSPLPPAAETVPPEFPHH